jgi:hypothetical protein
VGLTPQSDYRRIGPSEIHENPKSSRTSPSLTIFASIGNADVPPEQLWYAAMVSTPDLKQALESSSTQMCSPVPLDDCVKATSHDPEPARIRAHNERLRRESWARFVDHLAAKAPLRPRTDSTAVHRHPAHAHGIDQLPDPRR